MFKPDYSVVVKEDCTYLDVNVAAYVNAYKSTLMQRERGWVCPGLGWVPRQSGGFFHSYRSFHVYYLSTDLFCP